MIDFKNLDMNRIISSWSVEDVVTSALKMDEGSVLTAEDIDDIADTLHHEFDAGVGMNWNDVDCAVKEKLDEKLTKTD